MRLGQLARKLSVSPAEVTALLASKNIQTEEGTNTRLTDEQLTWILRHYGKEASAITLTEEVAKEDTPLESVDRQSGDLPQESAFEASSLPVEQIENQSVMTPSATLPADVDATGEAAGVIDENTTLIKASKVELSGLKILGKIELPEPKKKEVSEKRETEGEADAVKPEPPVQKGRQQPRGDRSSGRKQQRSREGNHARKNPIALQREREAREAEEKRQELARQEKERRTQYYQQRVKASVPTKPARLFHEPMTDMENERKQAPKSWFGRLLRWFKS